MRKRFFSVLCILVLCLTLLPVTALAAGGAAKIDIHGVDADNTITIDVPTISQLGETATRTYQVTATVYDLQNKPIANPDINWTLDNTWNGALTVDAETGLITITNQAARIAGTIQLTATCGTAVKKVEINPQRLTSKNIFGRITKAGQVIGGDSLLIPDDGEPTTASYTLEVYDHYGRSINNILGPEANPVTWSAVGANGNTVPGVTVTSSQGNTVTVSVGSTAPEGPVTLSAKFTYLDYPREYSIPLSLIKNSGASVSISGLDGPKTYGDDPFQLTASVSGQAGTGGTWTWESSDPDVLSLVGSGNTADVTILKAGTANIFVKYENGAISGSASVPVTVSPANLSQAEIRVYRYTVYTGKQQQYFSNAYLNGKLVDKEEYWTDALHVEDAGDYTVTIHGNNKNYTGTASTTFTVLPRNITDAQIDLIGNNYSRPYTGLPQTVNPDLLKVGITDEYGKPEMIYRQTYEIGNVGGVLSGINVGTYTITLTATDPNFTGTATRDWYIIPAELTITGATLAARTYDGTTDAEVTGVTFEGLVNNESLTLGTDYTATAEFDTADAGTGKTTTVTVTLKDEGTAGNYAFADGSRTATFTLTDQTIGKGNYTGPKDAAGSVLAGSPGSVDLPAIPAGASYGQPSYSGSDGAVTDLNITDGVLSYIGGSDIQKDRQYTAIVPVTGATNYEDYQITVTVTVGDKALDSNTMKVNLEDWTYGDTPKSPAISGVDGSNAVYHYTGTGDTSYGPSATPPTNAGTYQVTATYETDAILYTAIADFSVLPKSIGNADITLGSSLIYNGSEQTMTVSKVIVDGQGLTENTDYTVGGTVKGTDAGDYTLTINGTGNYAGTAEKTWNIAKATLIAKGTGTAEGTFGDTLSQLTISGLKAVIGADIEVGGTWALMGDAVPNVGDTGTYIAAFTPASGAGNFANTLTAEVSLNISKAGAQTLRDRAVTHRAGATGEQSANLTGLMPANAGALTYVKGTETGNTGIISSWSVEADGTVRYMLSGAGTAGQSVTLPVTIGSANYDDSTVEVVITLTEKEVPTVSAQDITRVYDGSPIPDSSIQGTADVDGVWSWKEGQALTEVKDSGAKAVVFTPTDSGYMPVEVTIQVTIQKATPTGAPKYTAITTSGKTLADAGLTTLGSTFSVPGTAAWEQAATTWVQANTAYRWIFTPADSHNYNSISGSIELWHQSFSGGGSSDPTYSVTLPGKISGGEITMNKRYAEEGEIFRFTVIPDKGYELNALTVIDSRGREIDLTDKGDGVYSFTMPARRVEIEVSFREIVVEPEHLPFTDVPEDAWYAEAVRYVYEHGLMAGTSGSAFSPEGATTRGQIVTILWRMAGSPVVNYAMDFEDVDPAAYYGEAVRWAVSEGVVGGYGNGLFGANDPITREQFAVMLYRYAQHEGCDVSIGEDTNILSYADAFDVSEYAVSALQWACGAGIISGTGDGNTLTPQGQATRAQAAVMLMRFCEEYVVW